jgi:trans-aconitate methyltransferase
LKSKSKISKVNVPRPKNQATTWNAAAYAANSTVQQSWARELIAKLKLRGDEHILDIGCGDGKVTAEIAQAVPRGRVLGVDASAEMIAFAKKTFPTSKISNLKFQICDARKIKSTTGSFDLVFSNAALHWMDDHAAVLRGAASVLKPRGRLVISCGGKGNAHDVFLALRPEMRLQRWRGFFRKMPMPYFLYAPGDYGFATWLRTTWLPFVQRVPENLREEFIAAVTRRYVAKHPLDSQRNVHVRMVRLEIDAEKV